MAGEDHAVTSRLGSRFAIKRELGSGASGTVYCVHDGRRRADVALKLLRSFDSAALIRFKREFRSLADIVDPHLVTLYELGSQDDLWFLLMELIDGGPMLDYVRPFRELIPVDTVPESDTVTMAGAIESTANTTVGSTSQSGVDSFARILRRQAIRAAQLDLDRLTNTFGQLARGLTRLHNAGKLHCDLKHSNVLVDHDGRAVLCDFGLVSEVSDRSSNRVRGVRGTPGYMSPEQACGRRLDESTDWYSAGVMLFEALTGELPFNGPAREVMRVKTVRDAPPVRSIAPGADPDLADLCDRLLRRAPDERATGADVLDVLGIEIPARRAIAVGSGSHLRPPFVGRVRQLAELGAALDESRHHAIPVLVGGLSGMGKSALCRQFIETARDRGAVVISGRCYERESVPHKALDALADNLCNYLMTLRSREVTQVLADDAGPLARIFPVFARLAERPGIAEDIEGDAQGARRAAFDAFTRVVRRISEHQPTILFIDDVQWGDVDSASFFSGLVHDDVKVPVLLLATFRSDHADGSALLRALMTPESPHHIAPRTIPLEGLTPEESRQLARAIVGDDHAAVASLAADAGGHPLFLTELARMGVGAGNAAHLDELLRQRIQQLPQEARALLEASSIAARPMPVDLLSQAAEIQDEPAAVAALMSGHLIRSLVKNDREQLVPYHDRIRQATVDLTSDSGRRHWHRRIARALEWSDEAEPIALVEHWLGAGDRAKAASYAEDAARRAEQALAFAQAAQYYRILIDLAALEGEALVAAWERLAEMLVNAGRLQDAAEAFLEAAAHAPPELATTLRSQASSELIRSGKIDEGMALAKEVLADVGLSLPDNKGRIIASILSRRAWLSLRGLAFKARPEGKRSTRLNQRVDACQALAGGLSFVLPVHGAYLHTRQLRWALATGDPYRAAVALSLEIGFRSLPGAKSIPQVRELVVRARSMGEEIDNPGIIGFALAGKGLAAFLAGEFQSAHRVLERAIRLLRTADGYSLRWQRGVVEIYRHSAALYLGDLGELSTSVPMHLRQALENGDEFSARALRAWRTNLVWLARDEPDVALEQAIAGAPGGDDKAFTIQHYYELVTRAQIELYTGDAGAAWERAERGFAALGRTMHLRLQSVRVEGRYLEARCALAAAKTAADARARDVLLAVARRDAKLLDKEKVEWATAKAAMVRGTIAHIRGDDELAVRGLREAIAGFERAAMDMHATIARRRLGTLLGGDEGEALTAAADHALEREAIADPERFTELYAPGW